MCHPLRQHPDQHPAENLHGVAGVSGNAAKRSTLERPFGHAFPCAERLPALRRIGNGSGVSDGNVKDDSQSAAANGDGDPADPYHCMDSADYSLVRHRRIVQGGGDRYGGILPHYDEHHERHLQYAGRLYRGGAAV